jgi:hypothetical protein
VVSRHRGEADMQCLTGQEVQGYVAGRPSPRYDEPPSVEVAEDLRIHAAAVAQQSFGGWPDRRVDGLLPGLAEVMAEHAGELAR